MKKITYTLPKKSVKKDYILNMYGSMATSFVSVILLIAVSYILGEKSAGIFSLSYSTAQMFYTLAVFEVRNIQVTDAKSEFSFSDCFIFRIITACFVLLLAVAFVLFNKFDSEKAGVIILLCVYMAILSVSEVFQGNLHKNGYLYIAGFSSGTSVLTAATVFVISVLLTKNLVMSVIPMILVMLFWTMFFDVPFSSNFDRPSLKTSFSNIKKLFLCTAPLIISVFINQYSLNCPKYAIDKYLTDVDQSHYGYLVMPAFCISLLSMFIFRPQTITLSLKWNEKKYKEFNKISAILFGWVIATTAIVLLGGYFVGIPILNLLYNTNLNDQKHWLMILLLGGGFAAASSLCCLLVAITRKQNYAISAYVISGIVSIFLPNILVKNIGFAGAPISYLIQNAVLFFALLIVLFITVFKKSKEKNF